MCTENYFHNKHPRYKCTDEVNIWKQTNEVTRERKGERRNKQSDRARKETTYTTDATDCQRCF